jgi:hypothetical protein
MGVTGNKLTWVAPTAAELPRLNGYDLGQLQRRVKQQVERIEAKRISAVRKTLEE